MTERAQFLRHWRRLQGLLVAFLVTTFVTLMLKPDALIWVCSALVAVWGLLIFRLRCWKCGERLMKSGGAHLQMEGSRMVRHKTCGAELA